MSLGSILEIYISIVWALLSLLCCSESVTVRYWDAPLVRKNATKKFSFWPKGWELSKLGNCFCLIVEAQEKQHNHFSTLQNM